MSLTDAQWARIEPLLPDRTRDRRQVIDAIAFTYRPGTPWTDCPSTSARGSAPTTGCGSGPPTAPGRSSSPPCSPKPTPMATSAGSSRSTLHDRPGSSARRRGSSKGAPPGEPYHHALGRSHGGHHPGPPRRGQPLRIARLRAHARPSLERTRLHRGHGLLTSSGRRPTQDDAGGGPGRQGVLAPGAPDPSPPAWDPGGDPAALRTDRQAQEAGVTTPRGGVHPPPVSPRSTHGWRARAFAGGGRAGVSHTTLPSRLEFQRWFPVSENDHTLSQLPCSVAPLSQTTGVNRTDSCVLVGKLKPGLPQPDTPRQERPPSPSQ
ncbi:transposase [Streptomyces murinus]|uniref:transposase n=1 Tax=Streptomyces murinus TaxID=33900 RepID=UPI001F24C368|nr:transposase [Streptomyces murinus]